MVQTVFDTTVGVLVLLYAITQGLLPQPPRLPDLPAFEIAFWAEHPQTFLIVTVALLLAIVVGIYLGHPVRRFWERVKQGLVILTKPRRYLREVAAWQGVGWLCRFAAFWFFLEAFGIGGSFGNVMLVMSVQAIANIVPFTPGGAGAQQALLVATLQRPVARRRPLLLGRHPDRDGGLVGGLGFAAILLVFRTTDWRGLINSESARAKPTATRPAVLADGEAPRLARPAGVAAGDPPLPGRALAGGEVVVVAAGQGLQGDQGRVVLSRTADAAGGLDLGLGRAADDALPAEAGTVEPVGQLDPAAASGGGRRAR